MRKNRPQPKKVFSFVVDGECEVWYLQMLRKNEKLQQINVEPKLPQKKKLSDQYKAVMELAGESEKVFWVIDFDTINKETSETKKTEKYFKNPRKDIYQRLKPKQRAAIENALKLDGFDFENTRRGLSEMHRIFTELGLN